MSAVEWRDHAQHMFSQALGPADQVLEHLVEDAFPQLAQAIKFSTENSGDGLTHCRVQGVHPGVGQGGHTGQTGAVGPLVLLAIPRDYAPVAKLTPKAHV